MGNRAVITTKKALENGDVANSNELGVYLHWNGGRDSVEVFLEYCKLKGYRTPDNDCYGWARLCQVIGNFFGGSTSIGIDRCCNLDCNNGDNGVYIIDGWDIVDRKYFNGLEQDEFDLNEMLKAVNSAQPSSEQFPDKYFDAEIVNAEDLEIGDVIYIREFDGQIKEVPVVGFKWDQTDKFFIKYTPVVKLYDHVDKNGVHDWFWNPNNYIRDEEVRRKKM